MSASAEYDKLLKKIAANIKAARKRTGLTQMDMVEHGFNYRHCQRLEGGLTGFNLLTLFRLSKIFKIKVSKLLD